MNVLIIRTDGKEETHDLTDSEVNYSAFRRELCKLLDADTFDIVILRDGRIMYVDDNGWQIEHITKPGLTRKVPVRANKPINQKATELYWSICKPGTTHKIVGDVAVVKEMER